MALPNDVEDYTIDTARDFLYTSLKACERYSKVLQTLVDDLNTKSNSDEWLEVVNDECLKGTTFHESQLSRWQEFSSGMTAYIDAVRSEADALALDELSLQTTDAEGNPKPKKESRFVHPELAKFKLDKQARILGKYGGTPALGTGFVMPRAPRESILRATASPAAVEIHYSRTENKDASNLARVMQFRAKKKEGEDEQAEWQKEVHEKRRSLAHNVEEEDIDPLARNTSISAAAASAYGTELTQRLRHRQVQVAEAQAVAQAAEKAAPVDELAAATPELASKLQHRKSTLAAEEAARLAALAEEAEPSTPPAAVWSNPGAAFGGELAAALQRRGATPATTSATAGRPSSSSYTTPPPSAERPPIPRAAPAAPPAVSPELAAILQRRRAE